MCSVSELEQSESTDSAESESSVQGGSGYEDETDGSKYKDLAKVSALDKVSIRSKNPFSKLGRQKLRCPVSL